MPAAGTVAVPPPIVWAQRADTIIVTVAVEVKDEKYEFTEDSLHFTANGVNTERAYEVTLNFADKIVPDDVTTKKTGQCQIQFQIPRKTPGPYWSSLTTDKKKPHFIKIDFNLWVDESLEDDEADAAAAGMGGLGGMGGAGGEDMMKYMNMFGQQGGAGAGGDSKHMFDDLDEAEDSDDEELPNLE